MTKFGLKKVYLFFSSAFIFLLHVPFVFAKTKPLGKAVTNSAEVQPIINAAPNRIMPDETNSKMNFYDSLRLGSLGLAKQVFEYAIRGFNCMKEMGNIENENIISIIDFSKPSSQKRLFVIDLKNCKLLFNTYVAHGAKSGTAIANQFSNIPESNKSSLGFYETSGTYMGKNGYSLYLQGMEKGINDNAYKRDIVMHGAEYVSENLIRLKGYIGRSWGCPAVPQQLHRPIIDKIKNGTCLFIFSPDRNYLSHSRILNRGGYGPDLAYN